MKAKVDEKNLREEKEEKFNQEKTEIVEKDHEQKKEMIE